MKVEITREQYEQLKDQPAPGLRLDMECKYWMEFTPATKTVKRNTKRRSPLDLVEPGPRWSQPPSTPELSKAQYAAEDLLCRDAEPGEQYMASGELAEKLAEALGTEAKYAGYRIRKLLEEKILRIRHD